MPRIPSQFASVATPTTELLKVFSNLLDKPPSKSGVMTSDDAMANIYMVSSALELAAIENAEHESRCDL